ncbi:MAG: SRPBCC domain-containing protein [Chloroflexi bacterium]|nr:SRPBCC domain-containing protein [Chloroflexota bacterium]
MSNGFELTVLLPASPEEIYTDWLDSEGHAALTGSPAQVDGRVGGTFSAWDGYITGVTLELEPSQRIVQAWRTTGFPEGAPDSRLEIQLKPVGGGTRLTLIHSDMPPDQEDSYRQGWEDFYFSPMREYFET